MSSQSDSISEFDLAYESDFEYEERPGFIDALHKQVSQVHTIGSFATHDLVPDFVFPNISLASFHGTGNPIRLPLDADDANLLIQSSHPASFGKDIENFDNDLVRKTWQIEADGVKFNNERWASCVDRIAKTAAKRLGVSPDLIQNIRTEFHKMLIYEKGAVFKAHRDTAKSPGMFATLVICLPAVHTGGDVCVKHGSNWMRFPSSEYVDATFMAWYNDVEHDVELVSSGYRWELVYNLINVELMSSGYLWELVDNVIKPSTNLPPSATSLDTRVTRFKLSLDEWLLRTEYRGPILYPLDHKYTKKNLEMTKLQGEDFHRAAYIKQSCAQHGGFTVLLANLEFCMTINKLRNWQTHGLYNVVDLDGFDLSAHERRKIEPWAILDKDLYKARVPKGRVSKVRVYEARVQDTQQIQGFRECWDPQVDLWDLQVDLRDPQVDLLLHDSVVLIIPSDHLWTFLLPTGWTNIEMFECVKDWMAKVRSQATADLKTSSAKHLRQLCKIGMDFISREVRKRLTADWIGWVAVSAAFINDMALFREAVNKATFPFDRDAYFQLGSLLDLEKLGVKDFMVLIDALRKGNELYIAIQNLESFRSGYQGDKQEAFRCYLDQIMINFLEDRLEPDDNAARPLIDFVTRSCFEDHQMNLFLRVCNYIDGFATRPDFAIPCLIEILHRVDAFTSPQLKALSRLLVEPVILTFDLQIYVNYICHKWDAECLILYPEMFASLCDLIQEHDSDLFATFFKRLRLAADGRDGMAHSIPIVQYLLSRLPAKEKTAAGPVLSSFRECAYTLLTTYISRSVGIEPKKPKDWSRPNEVGKCSDPGNTCVCLRLNAFLENPSQETCAIPAFRMDDHVRKNFQHLEISAVTGETIIVKKTLDNWQGRHDSWEDGCRRVRREIGQLPLDKLKECLGPEWYKQVTEVQIDQFDDGRTAAQRFGRYFDEI